MFITAPPPPHNPLDEICFFGVQTGKFPGSKIIGSAELKKAPLIFQRALHLRVIPYYQLRARNRQLCKRINWSHSLLK